MRKSKLLRSKIQALIERAKEIHEIQDELSTWRKQFISREGAQHLRRDDFVTYDDVYHIYQKIIASKFQKHKDEFPESQLFTVVVKDEYHNGIHVAFLIMTKVDSLIIANRFRKLSAHMGGRFKTSMAITVQGSTEIKAINDAFPECKVFLCFWHVLKAWKIKLSSKGATDDEREKAIPFFEKKTLESQLSIGRALRKEKKERLAHEKAVERILSKTRGGNQLSLVSPVSIEDISTYEVEFFSHPGKTYTIATDGGGPGSFPVIIE
ncbi:hypothetical protein BGX31_003662 [Mortierella sp. GBA43]|nr:hypothetical protein BGX31_003662 [Mortierella sp. GBA43]